MYFYLLTSEIRTIVRINTLAKILSTDSQNSCLPICLSTYLLSIWTFIGTLSVSYLPFNATLNYPLFELLSTHCLDLINPKTKLISTHCQNSYLAIVWTLIYSVFEILSVQSELLSTHCLDLIYPLAKHISNHCPNSYLPSVRTLIYPESELLPTHYLDLGYPVSGLLFTRLLSTQCLNFYLKFPGYYLPCVWTFI